MANIEQALPAGQAHVVQFTNEHDAIFPKIQTMAETPGGKMRARCKDFRDPRQIWINGRLEQAEGLQRRVAHM